ncbi:DUF1707 domain-containing protein [Nonomuraea sp. NPDC050556]|uniref:DUF1707 SHOCT-like domain-containing protein n=1 Tax=Nonomuraea sp. NPDC050556 TaxID=3364369 RepID=UPI0037A2CE26
MEKDVQPRASDEDRNAALHRLQQAFADGRLGQEEMEERIERALVARTHSQLAPVLADLSVPYVDEPVRLVSTGGSLKRGEGWRVPRRVRIESEYGGAELDLSRAIIEHGVIEIDLQLRYGSVRIWLPAGATVDIDRVATEWGRSTYRPARRSAPAGVHVRLTGRLGYGSLKVRHR